MPGPPRRPRAPRPAAPPLRRLGAVVLSRANVGEADVVATFLTRELGLVPAVAKNARKSVRRFGGGLLSPGAAAFYFFRIREGPSLSLVHHGEPNPKAPVLPSDPLVRALASWALELVGAFEAPRNPALPSFNLLLRHLGALSALPPEGRPFLGARALSLAFSKLYMEMAGFGPDFGACLSCGGRPGAAAPCALDTLGPLAWRLPCPWRSGGAEGPPDPSASLPLRLAGLRDPRRPPALSDPELGAAEGFYQALAASSSGRSFKTRKVILGFLAGPGGAGGP